MNETPPEIEKEFFEVDGSCRDLNFERPTWAGVGNLISLLLETYSEVDAHNEHGDTVSTTVESALEAVRNTGYVHFTFASATNFPRHMQLYICTDDADSPFVELTFFPDDFGPSENLSVEFLKWASEMQRLLDAQRFFARYENASWCFGETGKGSGVAYTS